MKVEMKRKGNPHPIARTSVIWDVTEETATTRGDCRGDSDFRSSKAVKATFIEQVERVWGLGY